MFNKTKKLLTNPKLFFYDYLKKRIIKEQIVNINRLLYIPENYRDIKKLFSKISLYKYKEVLYIEREKFLYIIQCVSVSKYDINIYIDNKQVKPNNQKLESIINSGKCCYIEVRDSNKFDSFYINLIDLKDGFYQSHSGLRRIAPEHISSIIENLIDFKVDVVFTYVDSTDIDWQKSYYDTFGAQYQIDLERYMPRYELKFALRSINMYMPWVNKIYIVTNCKKPSWLKDNNKIIFIDHKEIFKNPSNLPNFNSHAIESNIVNIKDLSDYFIYFNDDFIVNKRMYKYDFFDENGKSIGFRENYDVAFWDKSNLENPGYQAATTNSQELLMKTLNYCPRYMMQHAPYAINKKTLIEMISIFKNNIDNIEKNKIRSFDDINVLSFLYHHYAFYTGKAHHITEKTFIVRNTNIEKFISNINSYRFFCLNDLGVADSINLEKIFLVLNKRFNIKPSWEI